MTGSSKGYHYFFDRRRLRKVEQARKAEPFGFSILFEDDTLIIIIMIIIIISKLSLIVRVNVVLNRTVVDSDWCFDNLFGNHLQMSPIELYDVSWWFQTLVVDLIGQLSRDVIGRLSVKPRSYWLWRLEKSLVCFDPSIVRVKQLFIVSQIVGCPVIRLLHSLLKCQSLSTIVLLRTMFSWMIILNLLMKWLLGSNLSH